MPDKKNVYQRISAVMADVPFIKKTGTMDHRAGGYTFVSHDEVAANVQPAMVRHGLVAFPIFAEVTGNPNQLEVRGVLRFINVDNPDDRFDVPLYGAGMDRGDKAYGKACSYAVKYALLKTLCIPTGDNEEERTDLAEVRKLQQAIDAKKSEAEPAPEPKKKPRYKATKKQVEEWEFMLSLGFPKDKADGWIAKANVTDVKDLPRDVITACLAIMDQDVKTEEQAKDPPHEDPPVDIPSDQIPF